MTKTIQDVIQVFRLPKSFVQYNQQPVQNIIPTTTTNKQYSVDLATAKKNVITQFIADNHIVELQTFLTKLVTIADIQDVLNDILKVVQKHFGDPSQNHEHRIKNSLIEKYPNTIEEKDIKVVAIDVKSANEVFVVTIKEEQWYVKTCSNDPKLIGDAVPAGRIHPNELFIYKVMEKIGLGPQVEFLISMGASSHGTPTSIHTANYIMTKAVPEHKEESFVHDIDDVKTPLLSVAQEKDFAVIMSSAIATCDVLSVWDVFNANPHNYGLVYGGEKSLIQIIDHLPNASNGILSTLREKLESDSPQCSLQYSPRLHLKEQIKAQTNLGKQCLVQPIVDAAIHSRTLHKKSSIESDVMGNVMKVQKVLESCFDEINEIIGAFGINFVENASKILANYKTKIEKNLTTYQKVYSPLHSEEYESTTGYLDSTQTAPEIDSSILIGQELPQDGCV